MSSSTVPITVAVVISVLFCSIRAYYWFKGRVRPPPYASDSSYDIENQAIIGNGGGGQPLDHRPTSPLTGPAALTIVTSADRHQNHHLISSQPSQSKTSTAQNGGAVSLAGACPSSSLYHAVLRTVSFPSQPQTRTNSPKAAVCATGQGATHPYGQTSTLQNDTTPPTSPCVSPANTSPCVSSAVSHNNSSEAIHNATPPSKTCPPPESPAAAAPVPRLVQTAVSGSWLAMLRHQTYKRVASPTTPIPTSPLPSSASAPLVACASQMPTSAAPAPTPTSPPAVPAPPMLVVQPCSPRPFAFHAPSPTPSPPSSLSATTHASMSAPAKPPRRHPRRRTIGHGPMNLFRQMYAATPPLVETDEEEDEEVSERTGSGTSIVSDSGDSFADSLVEKGRLLPAGNKPQRGSAVRDGPKVKRKGVGKVGEGIGGTGSGEDAAGGRSVDQLGIPVNGCSEADCAVITGSESGPLDDDGRGEGGDRAPIMETVSGENGRSGDLEEEADETQSLTLQGTNGRKKGKVIKSKSRKMNEKQKEGSASPKSVKSFKSMSKKSKRLRRMSV